MDMIGCVLVRARTMIAAALENGSIGSASTPPDVMLIVPEWPLRALLRAQLIEDGHEVVAVDTWPIPRLYLRPGTTPRVIVVDLQGLPDPRKTLDEVRVVLPVERVLVVTALGSLTAEMVRERGFSVVERPATIGEIASTAASLLSRTRR